jgi:hypothetical protein
MCKGVFPFNADQPNIIKEKYPTRGISLPLTADRFNCSSILIFRPYVNFRGIEDQD